MGNRAIVGALAVALGVIVSAEQPARPRAVLITNDGALQLQGWRAGPNGYESFWKAAPRASEGKPGARPNEIVLSTRDAPPVVRDFDRDGSDDLLVLDAFGVTVYGKTPAYLPFETALASASLIAFVVADVDADGAPELATMRSSGNTREVEAWRSDGARLRRSWGQQLTGAVPLLLAGDVDGDGRHELVVWSGFKPLTLQVIGPAQSTRSAIVGASGGTPLAGRIADVDGDGAGELVLGTNGGKILVCKPRSTGDAFAIDVL